MTMALNKPTTKCNGQQFAKVYATLNLKQIVVQHLSNADEEKTPSATSRNGRSKEEACKLS